MAERTRVNGRFVKGTEAGATTAVAPRFVAGARLLIGDEYREVGEPVPEAESWPLRQVQAMLNLGRLIDLADKKATAAWDGKGPIPSGDPLVSTRQIPRKR